MALMKKQTIRVIGIGFFTGFFIGILLGFFVVKLLFRDLIIAIILMGLTAFFFGFTVGWNPNSQ